MSAPLDRDAELFELDHATCRALLGTQPVGRLVIAGNEPQVVPVNFRLVDGAVAFRTATESAAAGAVGDDVVFEVDMFDDHTRSGWSVVVRGCLTYVDPPTADVVTWAPGPREASMRISIRTMTGRLLRGGVEAPDRPPGGYL